MDDLQAIRRIKSGDIGGLETLISRYQEKALRTAYLVTHETLTAEEVVQETFVRFYERARHFDEQRAFEPYFLRMVVNAALNLTERKHCSTTSLDEEENLSRVESLLACASSIEEHVEFEQLKQEIRRAICELAPRQRVAIVKRYYLEMSEAEMSGEMDVTPGTIKRLLHGARTRLRTLLDTQRSEK